MDKTISLIGKTLTIVVMAIGVIFMIIVMSHGDDAFKIVKENRDGIYNTVLNPYFNFVYVVAILTVALVVIFAILGLFEDTKRAIRTILIMIVFAVLVVISYFSASGKIEGNVIPKFLELGKITEPGVRWVDAGIILTYITAGIAIVATIFAGVSGLFKRL